MEKADLHPPQEKQRSHLAIPATAGTDAAPNEMHVNLTSEFPVTSRTDMKCVEQSRRVAIANVLTNLWVYMN